MAIDKSKWPPGPWHSEPDHEMWRDQKTGYICEVKRNPNLGGLCGYVHLPKNHPCFGGDYNEIDVDIHGGLTFGEFQGEYFVVGFDCAHFQDLLPGMEGLIPGFYNIEGRESYHYWTFPEVIAEVESLAQQLKKFEEEK